MNEQVALWFLFLAYSAVFVIIFLYVGRAHRNTRKLEEEIRRLEATVKEDGEDGTGT